MANAFSRESSLSRRYFSKYELFTLNLMFQIFRVIFIALEKAEVRSMTPNCLNYL